MKSPTFRMLLTAAVFTFPIAIREASPQTKDVQTAQDVEEPQEPPVPSGFQVSSKLLLLRGRALDADLEYARPALVELGEESLDRVTVELLMALTRGRDRERAYAAGRALMSIAERAQEAGHRTFAGGIGEDMYLSSQAKDVRERAYPLFMSLDNERTRRHRR